MGCGSIAQTTGKLTSLKVQKLTEAGMHAYGGGLYLQVTGTGAKSWIFRFMVAGRARAMGLGSLSALSLADARVKAAECRRLRAEGRDPIEARHAERADGRIAAARAMTFNAAAEQFIASHKVGWRNPKHVDQWTNTLATYASPIFGELPVQAVDTALVMKALEAIWTSKPETASRVRGRIEAVLDWSAVRGHRAGENPARWRGHLDKLLPARSKVRAVQHHAAMPYVEVPAFLARLRALDALSASALEFAILTAARTGEVIGARWDEVDKANRVWIVPASRMKAGKEHRVPLTAAAMKIVDALRTARCGDYLFPGSRAGRPISNMAMDMALRRLKTDVTVHGFRSSFRDWAAERSSFPSECGRDGPGAHGRKQGRGRLPLRRSVREAAQADGGVGRVLCGAGWREGGCNSQTVTLAASPTYWHEDGPDPAAGSSDRLHRALPAAACAADVGAVG